MDTAIQERAAPSTELALTPAARAVLALVSNKAETELRALVALSTDIVRVADDTGREQVHRAAMQLRTARTGLEKKGKAARDDAQAFSKAVIAEERRLIEIVQPEEQRLLTLRDAWDEHRAAAERARVAVHEARLSHLEGLRLKPLDALSKTAAELDSAILKLDAYSIDSKIWEEFAPRAEAVRLEIISDLQAYLEQAKIREELEAQRARLAAQQAEIERQADELRAQQDAADARRRSVWLEEQTKLPPSPIPMQPAAIATVTVNDQQSVDVPKGDEASPAPADPLHKASSPSQEIGRQTEGADVLPAVLIGPPPVDEPATVTMGEIGRRLGFTLTADFVAKKLGIQPRDTQKAAKLYSEGDFIRIVSALVKHLNCVSANHATPA